MSIRQSGQYQSAMLHTLLPRVRTSVNSDASAKNKVSTPRYVINKVLDEKVQLVGLWGADGQVLLLGTQTLGPGYTQGSR